MSFTKHVLTNVDKLKKHILQWENIIPLLLFILVSAIYIHNLSTGIYGGDSGDFVTAIIAKGIPHPSGYPLYMMLGIIFSYLPINASIVWKISLISALFSSFTVVILYFIILRLTSSKLASLLSGLTLAFFYPFWIYAEVPEVFALHSFFILLLTFLAIYYLQTKNIKILYMLFFTFGLSLTNNETIVLFLVPFLLFLFTLKEKKLFSGKSVLKFCLFFVLGLIPYLYIPIAASYNPSINWMHVNTLGNFMNLVTRGDYGWKLNEHFDLHYAVFSLSTYIKYITLYMPFLLLIIVFFGAMYLFYQKQKQILVFLLMAFIVFGPFFVIFARFPLNTYAELGIMQRFFIGSLLFLFIFLTVGVFAVSEKISYLINKSARQNREKRNYIPLFLLIFFLLPASFFIKAFPKTDFSLVKIGDYYAEDILRPLPKDSIIFFTTDTPAFNTLYLQYANNFRTDIQIPGSNNIQSLVLGNANLSDKQREGLLRDKSAFTDYIFSQVSIQSEKSRPIFVEQKFMYDKSMYGEQLFMPYGLLFKVATIHDKNLTEDQYISLQSRNFRQIHTAVFYKENKVLTEDLILSDIKVRYIQAYENTGKYIEQKYNDKAKAKLFYAEADKLK